jgi:hypothetical protein
VRHHHLRKGRHAVQRLGFHSPERTTHFVQWTNASRTDITSASSGVLPSTAMCSRTAASRTMEAVPLTRSVSALPGMRKISPTRGLRRTLRKVSARRSPGRSGMASARP